MIKADGLIFDMDGTLWDTTAAITDSWNIVFEKLGLNYKATPQEIDAQMGKPMSEIFSSLFPNEGPEMLKRIEDECCAYENEYLSVAGGILYPNLPQVLALLSEKMPLFIVSNCQDGYIEAFFAAHKLSHLFKDYECWGRTRITKAENIKLVVSRNGLKNPVYIGDTALDGASSREAGVPFVYAAYGFGKTDDFDAKIDSFSQLLELFGN